GDAAGIGKARAPAPPDERHSILDGERGSIERASHRGIALRFHEAVHRDAAHILTTALVGPLFEHRNGPGEIDRGDAHSENVHSGKGAQGIRRPVIKPRVMATAAHQPPPLPRYVEPSMIAGSYQTVTFWHFSSDCATSRADCSPIIAIMYYRYYLDVAFTPA